MKTPVTLKRLIFNLVIHFVIQKVRKYEQIPKNKLDLPPDILKLSINLLRKNN